MPEDTCFFISNAFFHSALRLTSRLVLENLKLKNNQRLFIGNLNINSISNKFENLKLIIQGKINIFVITQNKTASNFPLNQLAIQVYSKPYRLIEIEMEVGFLYMFEKIFYNIYKNPQYSGR